MPFQFKTINEIPITAARAVVCVDFNVPIENGEVTDPFRIEKTWPTIEALLKKNLQLTLLSHLGEGGEASLNPVAEYFSKYAKVAVASSIEEAKVLQKDGVKIILLENIRRFPGEKENSPVLSKSLSELGDIYVNEAFSVSHRAHASIVGVPKLLPSFAGPVLVSEIENLSKAFNPEHPFFLILGGKKASTKIPLVEKFLGSADKIFVAGALANDFLNAKGVAVGKSLLSEGDLINKEWLSENKIVLPENAIVEKSGISRETDIHKVEEDERIVDAGSDYGAKIASEIKGAKTVVWNGSFGICEAGFDAGTKDAAKAVIESGAFSIVGGGDTTAAIDKFGLTDKFSFVSTGGGAMLEFLAKGTLPGIEALKSRAAL